VEGGTERGSEYRGKKKKASHGVRVGGYAPCGHLRWASAALKKSQLLHNGKTTGAQAVGNMSSSSLDGGGGNQVIDQGKAKAKMRKRRQYR